MKINAKKKIKKRYSYIIQPTILSLYICFIILKHGVLGRNNVSSVPHNMQLFLFLSFDTISIDFHSNSNCLVAIKAFLYLSIKRDKFEEKNILEVVFRYYGNIFILI